MQGKFDEAAAHLLQMVEICTKGGFRVSADALSILASTFAGQVIIRERSRVNGNRSCDTVPVIRSYPYTDVLMRDYFCDLLLLRKGEV